MVHPPSSPEARDSIGADEHEYGVGGSGKPVSRVSSNAKRVSRLSALAPVERDKTAAAFAPLLDASARDRGPVRFVRLRDLVDLLR